MTPARPPRSRRAAAAECKVRARNQRQWRARQRDGIAIAFVPYDSNVINFLIATRWLDPARADDRTEIGKAIAALIADAAR